MRIKTKHMLTYGLACGVAAVAVGGVRLLSSGDRVAEAESVTVETADITMVKGASARINSDGHNGLRYTMRVAKEDYEAIKADASYTDVTFGILIAPQSYTEQYALTQEYVFDEATAKYDWAEYDEETKEWVYTGTDGADGSKTRIINLTSQTLAQETTDESSDYVLYGSITDIKTENIALQFTGVGYVSYTQDETVKYRFLDANDNVRSMAYIAQVYQTLPDDVVPPEDKEYVLSTYITGKADTVDTVCTVKYMLEQDDCETYKEDVSLRETINAKINSTADISGQTFKTVDGYEYKENSKAVLSALVYADGKTELKVYYDKVVAEPSMTAHPVANGVELTQTGSSVSKNEEGLWTSEGSALRYFRETMKGDFSVSAAFTLQEVVGQAGVILNGGVEAQSELLFKAVPWEMNQIFVKCGVTGYSGDEISVTGFATSFAADENNKYSGSEAIKLARIGNLVYVYDSTDTVKIILGGENTIELVNGATFNYTSGMEDVTKCIKEYFAQTTEETSETAIGLWAEYAQAGGKTTYNVVYNDAAPAAPDESKFLAAGGNVTINGNTEAKQAQAMQYNAENGTWSALTGYTLNFLRDQVEGDFSVDVTFSVKDLTVVNTGTVGIMLNCGTDQNSALSFLVRPRDGMVFVSLGWRLYASAYSGFVFNFSQNSDGTYSGSGTLRIVKIADRIYLCGADGVAKLIVGGSAGITCSNGAEAKYTSDLATAKPYFDAYFAATADASRKTAVGLWVNDVINEGAEVTFDVTCSNISDDYALAANGAFGINGNSNATQAGDFSYCAENGTWMPQSNLALRFFNKKLTGDFTIDAEFVMNSASGQSGIVFNTGVKTAEALAIKAVPWENKIFIMQGWNISEISVNGIELDFTYDAGTDTYSGTARLKIARIGDRLYIYDKYGVEKVILGGENSIELVNGASFDSDKTIPDGVKTAIATYFANTSAQGSETAIGLWCDNNNGCAEYKIAFNGKAVTV